MKPGNMRFSVSGKLARKAVVHSPANAARKALLRRIQRQELRKLQSMLPGSSRSRLSSTGKEADPCAVIASVIDYIDSLHSTILARVKQGTLSPDVLNRIGLPSAATPPVPTTQSKSS